MSYQAVSIGSIGDAKLRKCVRTGSLNLSKEILAGSNHSILLHPGTAAKVLKAKQGKRGARVLIVSDEIKFAMEKHAARSVWKPVWVYAQREFAKRGE